MPPKLPAVRQLPPIAKQPPVVRLKPTFDVDVDNPFILNPLTVVVPLVPSIVITVRDVVAVPSTVVVDK